MLNLTREEHQIRRDKLELEKTGLQKMSDEILGTTELNILNFFPLMGISTQ